MTGKKAKKQGHCWGQTGHAEEKGPGNIISKQTKQTLE